MKNKGYTYIKLIGLTLFILVVGVQLSAPSIVENFLAKKIPEHIQLSYEQLEVTLLMGKIQLTDISAHVGNRDTTEVYATLKAKRVTLNGIGLWKFFTSNTLAVEEFILDTPNFEYRQKKSTKPENKNESGIVRLLKTIAIEKSVLKNGSLSIISEHDSVLFKGEQISFQLVGAATDAQLIDERIPFQYESYSLAAQNLFFDLGVYEELTIAQMNIADNRAVFEGIDLHTIYNKIELSRQIHQERDHVALNIPSLELHDFDMGLGHHDIYLNTRLVTVNRPYLEVYRDKRVADNHHKKQLHGAMLRAMPLALAIDSIAVIDGQFQYEEKTWSGEHAGVLFFSPLTMDISNIGNTYENGEKTLVRVNAKMMGTALMDLSYEFDVNDPKENFQIEGSLKQLHTEEVNPFLKPNVGVQTSGLVNALYFTAAGTDFNATGDLKMAYEDFKFEVLRKDKSGINRALTTIGNWLINDGGNTDPEGYRHGKITVTRDKQKSFFNYLWIMVEDGVLSTLVGKSRNKND